MIAGVADVTSGDGGAGAVGATLSAGEAVADGSGFAAEASASLVGRWGVHFSPVADDGAVPVAASAAIAAAVQQSETATRTANIFFFHPAGTFMTYSFP